MPAYAVIGGQWGDEGKGKIVDYCAENMQVLNPNLNPKISTAADIVARCSGGNNAGHTVWNPFGEFKLHLVPCGIANPRVGLVIISAGVVVHPETIDTEHETPEKRGEFQVVRDRLGVSLEEFIKRVKISTKAHLVFSWHIAEDFCQEVLRAIEARQRRGEKDFQLHLSDITGLGTTLRGIGPAYTDKSARFGIRVEDLLISRNEQNAKIALTSKLVMAWNRKVQLINKFYLDRKEVSQEIKHEAWRLLGDFNALRDKILEFREKFQGCFSNTERILYEAKRAGKNILLEGAQGALIDIDHGTYPFVTSSNCGIAGLYTSGVTKLDGILGVYKAYCTRVGSGDLTTEMFDDDEEIAELIRKQAWEYGVTTGRARRIGWFDAAAARHSAMLNGMTALVITRADILDSVDLGSVNGNKRGIKIGIGYNCNHNGPWKDKNFPNPKEIYCDDFDHWRQDVTIEPVYEEMPSWGPVPIGSGRKGVFNAQKFNELPAQAQAYLRRIEELVRVPLRIVSTGPKRDQTIILPSP